MLKADFHLHTNKDPKDKAEIGYSPKKLLNYLSKKGFEIASITHHNQLYYPRDLVDYSQKKGILLIPSIELKINQQEFLILMKKPIWSVEKIKSYQELYDFKKKYKEQILIICAHLYYPRNLFDFFRKKEYGFADAFEYSNFYLKFLNFNKKAARLAKKLKKPMIGTSDAHFIFQINNTYTLIESKKDINSIFKAIKKGDVQLVTRPFFFRTFIKQLNPITLLKTKFSKKGL